MQHAKKLYKQTKDYVVGAGKMSRYAKWNIKHAAASSRLEGLDINPKVIELYEDYYDGKISYDFFISEKDRLIQEEMDAAGNE